MMIRTQDKLKLVPFNRCLVIFQHSIIYNDEAPESEGILLGTYESDARCIEILDEIQKLYLMYLKSDGGPSLMVGGGTYQPFAFIQPKVYKMPQG